MNILMWEEFVAHPEAGPWAVAIGVFDGVHLGHRRLVQAVLEASSGYKSAVVTFRENPKKILRPTGFKGDISGLGGRLEALASLGLDSCVLIDFSLDFGTLLGAEFLKFLAGAGVKSVHIGPNFRCGHKMETNAQSMAAMGAALGVAVTIVDPVLRAGHPVSSSRIRNAILEGAVDEAALLLGRPHRIFVDENGNLDRAVVAPPPGLYRVALHGKDWSVPGVAELSSAGLRIEGECEGLISLDFINLVSREL
ncbi:MAG: riboflavin kinase / FMN adenylyltransferase [Spirochaetes bacterium]|nr:MAG: riboflavin kinase / FMN adenylyltransferase [Spirochaetota bacterium]